MKPASWAPWFRVLTLALTASVLAQQAQQAQQGQPAALSFEAEQELLAHEIKSIFESGNATCRKILSCCLGSPATVSEQLWSHVKAFAHNYHVRELLDSTPRMLERHYTFYNLWDRMKRAGSMQVFAADCYFGVVAMLLNALPAIEFEDGLTVAQEIFLTAVEMLERNNETEAANWTIPREPLELQMPLFLGLLPNNCAGSKLRIYVYETGSFSVGSIFWPHGFVGAPERAPLVPWTCSALAMTLQRLAWLALMARPSAAESPWQEWAREVFVDFIEGIGCQDCSQLLDQEAEMQFTLSSNIFGCADIDVLLPSLHWLYESRRFDDGVSPPSLPGLLVDGGANVGRATARWISSFGDSFSRQISSNPSVAPCVVCNGQSASQKQVPGLAATPNVAVVAVEPSDSNFQLLLRHSKEHGWEHEAFLPLKAALGGARALGHLAVSEDFAIDEVATLLWEENDPRRKQEVEVITLSEVVEAAQKAFPELLGNDRIFLLKLDIEGLEPAVLRSLGQGPPVKFVSFEYAANVWKDRLSSVLQDLYAAGYFCFLITSEQLFPVSGPFWSNIYELPMWSNFFCGQEGDSDLESLVQLHVGAVGLWPRIAHSYLPELAEDDTQRRTGSHGGGF
eukprot:s1781_g13.t2